MYISVLQQMYILKHSKEYAEKVVIDSIAMQPDPVILSFSLGYLQQIRQY